MTPAERLRLGAAVCSVLWDRRVKAYQRGLIDSHVVVP